MLKRLLITFLFLSLTSITHAADTKEIWITPEASDYSRLATGLAGSNITVISKKELIASKHKSIPEILSSYSGIQIRSLYSGVDSSNTTLDMRGFGESSGKNVMILLNGRRLNDIDMSGVNFSSIPNETIERIEIVRGGSASTIYGDGAVGGAINIVTKDAIQTNSLVSTSGSSYNSYKGEFTIPLLINENTGISVSGSTNNSDTFRDKANYSSENLLIRINHNDERYKLNFDITDSSSKNLLPGPRSIANLGGSAAATDVACNLLSDSRTAARLAAWYLTPGECWEQDDDFADFDIQSFSAGLDYDLSDSTKIISNISNRNKEQRALSFSPATTVGNSTSGDNYNVYNLDTDYLSLRLVHNDFINGNLGRFTLGVDIQDTVYNRKTSQNQNINGSILNSFGRFIDSSQLGEAIYFQNVINLFEGSTVLSFGARRDKADYKVNERYDNNVAKFQSSTARDSYQVSMSNTATNIGIEHILNKNMIISLKYAKSFRTPDIDARNVVNSAYDEFTLNDQTSKEYEIGFRFKNEKINLSSSFYEMDTNNEIRYVPSFNNTNMDPIKREGVNLDIVYSIADNLDLKGAFSYVDARFKSGSLRMAAFGGTYAANSTTAQTYMTRNRMVDGQYLLAGLKVPLVSTYNYNMGLAYKINSNTNASLEWSYVDDKYPSNDQENIEPVIPGYHLIDTRISTSTKKNKWSFGINNILDTKYYDFAVTSTTHMDSSYGRRSVYPLMGRNISLDYTYNF
jgi:iron complex outermembrane receptor protein